MILDFTDKSLQRLLTIGGGATGGVVAGAQQTVLPQDTFIPIPESLLLITWHQALDIALTAALGAAVGWAVHLLLNWIKKSYRKRKNKKL